MINVSSKTIFNEVEKKLGDSSLKPYESSVLSLQLLGWSKMSYANEIGDHLKINNRLNLETGRIQNIWSELSSISDAMKSAYSNWSIASRVGELRLRSAIEVCIKLCSTGMIGGFDPCSFDFFNFSRGAGENLIPQTIAEVMMKLARIRPSDTVYTPWDSYLQLSLRAAKSGSRVFMETPADPTVASLLRIFSAGNIEMAASDPITQPSAITDGRLQKFNVCVAFPPAGSRYKPDDLSMYLGEQFRDRVLSGTALAIWHIVSQTDGRAVIAVPNTFLASHAGDHKKVREELVRRRLIESVTAMPQGIFQPFGNSFAIMVLNTVTPCDSIRFVNADNNSFRESVTKSRAQLVNVEGIVSRSTGLITDELVTVADCGIVAENGCTLQVNRYVLPEYMRRTADIMKTFQTKELDELLTIIRPMPSALSATDHDIPVRETGAADIPEFGYIGQPVKEIKIDAVTARKNARQFLVPYDIVLIIKGAVGKIGIVPENAPGPGEGGWVAGQSCVILRLKSEDPVYAKVIAVFLRSPLGQKLLEGITLGATIPMIQLAELQKLRIAIPDPGQMNGIAGILDSEAGVQKEISALKHRQAAFSKAFWQLE